MSENEIAALLAEYKSLKTLNDDINKKMKTIEGRIKALMGEQEELAAGGYRVRWSHYKTSRLDSKSLQQRYPKIFDRFLITSQARRFTVS